MIPAGPRSSRRHSASGGTGARVGGSCFTAHMVEVKCDQSGFTATARTAANRFSTSFPRSAEQTRGARRKASDAWPVATRRTRRSRLPTTHLRRQLAQLHGEGRSRWCPQEPVNRIRWGLGTLVYEAPADRTIRLRHGRFHPLPGLAHRGGNVAYQPARLAAICSATSSHGA